MKPTIEEMVEWITRWTQLCNPDEDNELCGGRIESCPKTKARECMAAEEAIRAALVKLGGWQKILKDAERHGQDVRECTFILCEVRDFGEEG